MVPGEDPEPTEEKNAKLTLKKETTSTPADGKYVLDEQITYQVTAKNEGNVTLTNIKVVDELTGDEWTIASLAPGAEKVLTTKAYVVTVDDVVNGSVTNKATATAVDPEGEAVNAEAEITDETKKRNDNEITPEPGDDDETMDAEGKSITVVYDGKAHSLTATATAEGSTIWYSTDGGATWTTTPPSRTAVGTTTFSIKATNPAYEDVVKEGYKLTVLPKALTITIDDATKVYGTEDPEFTYTIEGLVDGESFPANLITIFRDAGEDVGTYTIHGKLGKKAIAMNLFSNALISIGNSIGGHNVKAAFDVNNYDVSFKEGTLEITPATVVVKADYASKRQGTKDPKFTATVTGLVNGDDESVISYTLSREPGENPGKYTITPAGEEQQGNYIVVFETGTLTITAKPALGNFSLVWLTDTLLTKEGKHADGFDAIIKHVAENVKNLGAIAMLDSGNMVETYNDADAWTFMQEELKQFKQLRPELPFFSVAGTKDVNGDAMDYESYLATEPNPNARTFKTVTKQDGDEAIWYQHLREQPVLLVGIGYQKLAETDEEKERQDEWLKFLNKAIQSHGDDFVVLLVNDYIDKEGELTEFGKLVEEELVKNNENVRLILCGNAEGEAQWVKNYGGRKVTALMYNYTADEENGIGFVRFLTFNGDDESITVSTYNPLTDVRRYDEKHPEKDNFVITNAYVNE